MITWWHYISDLDLGTGQSYYIANPLLYWILIHHIKITMILSVPLAQAYMLHGKLYEHAIASSAGKN